MGGAGDALDQARPSALDLARREVTPKRALEIKTAEAGSRPGHDGSGAKERVGEGGGAGPVPGQRVQPDAPGDMPEGAGGSMSDRLAHAKWDVRAYAYQEVAVAIFRLATLPLPDGKADADWEEHAASVAKGLGETNVAVLDKALNAAQQFLYYAPIPLCQQLASSCAEVLAPHAHAISYVDYISFISCVDLPMVSVSGSRDSHCIL